MSLKEAVSKHTKGAVENIPTPRPRIRIKAKRLASTEAQKAVEAEEREADARRGKRRAGLPDRRGTFIGQ
jgi:hypothetical protein